MITRAGGRKYARFCKHVQTGRLLPKPATDRTPSRKQLNFGLTLFCLTSVSLSLNGIKVARIIRQRCPQSKIIFLTENRDTDIRSDAMSTGASGYILKVNA